MIYLTDWLINGRQDLNLLCKRIPNNICRYAALQWVEHNAPLMKCGLHVATSFQTAQYGRGKKVTLQWRILKNTPSVRRSKLTSTMKCHADNMHLWYDVRKVVFTSVIFLSKTHNASLIMRKTSHKPQLRSTLQNLTSTPQGYPNQGRAEKPHSPEEPT